VNPLAAVVQFRAPAIPARRLVLHVLNPDPDPRDLTWHAVSHATSWADVVAVVRHLVEQTEAAAG
jgi:hypothetical protein